MLAPSRRGAMVAVCLSLFAAPAMAQQRGSITGKIVDADGLAMPGAAVTVKELQTGTTRSVVTAETGAYQIVQLDPGTYSVNVEMQGFNPHTVPSIVLTAGMDYVLNAKLAIAGIKEEVTVTAAQPLVERTSNKIGGTLSGKEIDEIPANFRNFTALTQLIPGMTPNPAQSSFEGGQVVANGSPAISNLYLLDGQYNNDDRLGGSQGSQVRVVLDNISEYQVLSNQYSSEYGGGAGAIINMVTVSGTNKVSGRAYTYYRDDQFNATNYFVEKNNAAKPKEHTSQSGFAVGGPVVKDKVHFYGTIERDQELNAGLKIFPPAAAPLAVTQEGAFEVLVHNYFGRGDVQVNDKNFLSVRWVLEVAPTKGENFNTNTAAPDARSWESDWDQLFGASFTSVVTDRASNVLRVSRVSEQLGTGVQSNFIVANNDPWLLGQDGVKWVGFNGRDPFTIGPQNVHPDYLTGLGGTGLNTPMRTYIIDDSFNYFVPKLWGGEHTFKFGGGYSKNGSPTRYSTDTGTFTFRKNAAGTNSNGDLPYDPANPLSYPVQFDIAVGPSDPTGWVLESRDDRVYSFFEDKWRVGGKLTYNLGIRYDHQTQTPADKSSFAPRVGFVWDVTGNGLTVVRGGWGRFYSYTPISVDLALQGGAIQTPFPAISVTSANDPGCLILCPAVTTDSAGNKGVAILSAAGIAELQRRRASLLSGATFSTEPRLDDPNRKMMYQDSWSLGLSRELGSSAAMTLDYVGNISRDQFGLIDINEPNAAGVRPGVAVFDPTGALIPGVARSTNFARVLQYQTNPAFDGDYQSLQLGVIKRMSNHWSGRVAYTLQRSHYTGLGAPDARRVWLDNTPEVDYGLFQSNRTHVLAMSGSVNPYKSLTIASVVSAISGVPINETTGLDGNKDKDTNDRPIKGIDDLTLPILSPLDSQGRAVINGMKGPKSIGIDVSFRYQIPIPTGLKSLDLFYDVFNITNNVNYTPPTGNRGSALFNTYTAAGFPRQMQFGMRVRF
jgi:carboxypeptidase family protein/TonB-dependent receptor-like protein